MDSLCYRDISSEQIITYKGDNEESKFVEFSFVSETPHRRIDWESWELIDEVLVCDSSAIVGSRLESGLIQYLWNHHPDKVRGVIESINWKPQKGFAKAKLSRSPESEQLYKDIQDGIIKGISVGYRVHKYEVLSEAVWEGDRWDAVLVTPKQVRAIEWEPFEISATSIPADATVGIGRSIDAPIGLNLGKFIRSVGVDRIKKAVNGMAEQNQDVKKTSEYLDLDQQYRDSQAKLHTLSTENEALKGQIATLQGEVQKYRFEADITGKFSNLRSRADTLLQETKLSAHEYQEYFAGNVSEMLSLTDPLAKLSALDMYLDMVEKRAPNLKTQASKVPAEVPGANVTQMPVRAAAAYEGRWKKPQ